MGPASCSVHREGRTVNSAGGRQEIELWDSEFKHIDSSALRHSWPLAVAKRMRTVGSTVWFVGRFIPKCSIGNEVPSVYPSQN